MLCRARSGNRLRIRIAALNSFCQALCTHLLALPGLCQSLGRRAIDAVSRMADPLPSPSLTGAKILLVDQDAPGANTLKRQLSELGYRVSLASDSRSATAAIVAQ